MLNALKTGEFRIAACSQYPTTNCAGPIPSQTVVCEMNAESDFQRDVAEAKGDIGAAQTAKNSK